MGTTSGMDASEVPTSFGELQRALRDGLTNWAPGQRRIAQLLIDDPNGTAFRSIADTARLADVHQSSVVRFANTLGLKGYPQLVALCREHVADEALLVHRFGRSQHLSETGVLLAETLRHDEENLRRTLARIDESTWKEAVAAVADAPRVHVMGLRKCLPVAQLLAYLLRMVRPGVVQIAPTIGGLVDDLRELQAGDVFIGISISRYTADTVHAFHAAREKGLTTIAMSDSSVSPLADHADLSFVVDCEGVTIFRSVSSFIALAQALATAAAVHAGKRSRDELDSDERILHEFNVYKK